MVKWSNPAKQDLRMIFDYIKKDSLFYARKVIQEILDKSESLEDYPNVGRVVPELNEPNIREVLTYSFRMVNQIGIEGIEILALIHSRRNFMSSFNNNQQDE